jgi:hypothetical protein
MDSELLKFHNGSGIFYSKVVADTKKRKIIASLFKVLSRSSLGKTKNITLKKRSRIL